MIAHVASEMVVELIGCAHGERAAKSVRTETRTRERTPL
jgi:hypothetical protein